MPSNKYSRIAFILLALFDAVIWYLIGSGDRGHPLELYFLDVGQGDSEFIRLPDGVDILIDGGPPNGKVLEELARILPADDTYIDLVMMSHPQLDHFGGLIDVLKKYEVGRFLGSGRKGIIPAYSDLIRVMAERNVKYEILGEGDSIRYRDNAIDILSPDASHLKSKELNDTTLVAMLREGNFRALYTGDIGFNVEDKLAAASNLHVNVLKVPHHGSKFSSGKTFLDAVTPQIAAIEVGKNSYGHPTKEALARLEGVGATVFRTDRDGAIKISIENDRIRVFRRK